MADEQKRLLKSRGRKKRLVGISLFWTGVISIIVSIMCFLSAWGGGNLRALILFYITAPIGVLFVFIGIILFFVWKREIKLQCNAGQSKNPRL
jgi:hypothetical protein